jgi:hypothetical protein
MKRVQPGMPDLIKTKFSLQTSTIQVRVQTVCQTLGQMVEATRMKGMAFQKPLAAQ